MLLLRAVLVTVRDGGSSSRCRPVGIHDDDDRIADDVLLLIVTLIFIDSYLEHGKGFHD